MKKFKMSLVALLTATLTAMMAVSAVGAASASAALPEFVTHNNPEPFTSHSATATGEIATLETEAGREVVCHNTTGYTVTDTGDITPPRSSTETVTFTGKCEAVTALGDFECKSASQAKGTIKTEPLVNKPVYLGEGETAAEGVGLALSPASGTVLAKFECETPFITETITVTGSIVCPITPINTLTTTYTLTCSRKGTEAGIQEYVGYWENEEFHPDSLASTGTGIESFGPEPSAQITTANIITSEQGEIKA